MAQLTIEISDDLAQRLAPFQNQLPELFARLIATTLPDEHAPQTGLPVANFAELLPMYAEVLDFLVTRPTFEQIMAFKVSERSQIRLRELLDKNRSMSLTSSEIAELNMNEQLDTLMTLLKVRARTTANDSDSS
jgi:HKD family nuclease